MSKKTITSLLESYSKYNNEMSIEISRIALSNRSVAKEFLNSKLVEIQEKHMKEVQEIIKDVDYLSLEPLEEAEEAEEALEKECKDDIVSALEGVLNAIKKEKEL